MGGRGVRFRGKKTKTFRKKAWGIRVGGVTWFVEETLEGPAGEWSAKTEKISKRLFDLKDKTNQKNHKK